MVSPMEEKSTGKEERVPAGRGLFALLNRVVSIPEKVPFGVTEGGDRRPCGHWGKGIPSYERTLIAVGSRIQVGNVCVFCALKHSGQGQALNS